MFPVSSQTSCEPVSPSHLCGYQTLPVLSVTHDALSAAYTVTPCDEVQFGDPLGIHVLPVEVNKQAERVNSVGSNTLCIPPVSHLAGIYVAAGRRGTQMFPHNRQRPAGKRCAQSPAGPRSTGPGSSQSGCFENAFGLSQICLSQTWLPNILCPS